MTTTLWLLRTTKKMPKIHFGSVDSTAGAHIFMYTKRANERTSERMVHGCYHWHVLRVFTEMGYFFYSFLLLFITKYFSLEMRKVKHICYSRFEIICVYMRTKLTLQTSTKLWNCVNLMIFCRLPFVWRHDFNDTLKIDIIVCTVFFNPLIKFYTAHIFYFCIFIDFRSSNKL